MKVINKDGCKVESEMLNLLKINADLFTCDTPLGKNFDEFSRLSGMDDDLFAYEVKLPEPSQALGGEQQYDDLKNNDLEIFEPRKCYDEYERMFAEAVILINGNYKASTWLIEATKKHLRYMNIKRHLEINGIQHTDIGDDDEVLTDEELSDLEKENLDEENKIAEIFKIETNIFHIETPLCMAFEEFNYLLPN
ncbi:hypothetical protein Tco_1391494 [Tanacetum coccineum]